jgi:hypothetical protein
MGLPPGAGLLGLAVAFVVLYTVVSIGYRRVLFRWLPGRAERSPDADRSAGQGEHHCPHCGAINETGFEKCYECGRRLPTESTDT